MIQRLPSKIGIRRYNLLDMDRDEIRTYHIWKDIRNRTTNPGAAAYSYYGGRGIKMSAEFTESFEAFWECLGPPPSRGHSVDRIDNNKGYERGNLRWETKWGQMRNRRCTLFVEWNGKTQCIADWAKETGINPVTLWGRFKRGFRGDALFAKPTNRGRQAVFETINGETKTLTQWAMFSGHKVSTIIGRYGRGWRGAQLLVSAEDGWKIGASKRPNCQPAEKTLDAAGHIIPAK